MKGHEIRNTVSDGKGWLERSTTKKLHGSKKKRSRGKKGESLKLLDDKYSWDDGDGVNLKAFSVHLYSLVEKV